MSACNLFVALLLYKSNLLLVQLSSVIPLKVCKAEYLAVRSFVTIDKTIKLNLRNVQKQWVLFSQYCYCVIFHLFIDQPIEERIPDPHTVSQTFQLPLLIKSSGKRVM